MRETVTASGIVRDYLVRDIAPNETHQVKQGVLHLWIWNNLYIGKLQIGNIEMTSQYAYRNTVSPQRIADDIYGNDGDLTIAQLNPSTAAAALGKIKSPKKTLAARKNGAKGGWKKGVPRKKKSESGDATQQSVHWTAGILRGLRHYPRPKFYPLTGIFSPRPAASDANRSAASLPAERKVRNGLFE